MEKVNDHIGRNKTAIFWCGYLLTAALFCGAFYSFCFAGVSGDQCVFFAAANQVQYQGNTVLEGLFRSFDVRGVLNHITFYSLYRIVGIFVDYQDIIRFVFAAKILYASFLCVLMTAGVLLVRKKYRLRPMMVVWLSMLCSLPFLAVAATSMGMHAEMSALLFMMISFALLLNGKRGFACLAGVILSLIFLYKPVFVIFPLCVYAAYLLMESKRSYKNLISSILCFLFSSMSIVAYLFYAHPQELRDYADMAQFQKTLLSAGSTVTLHSMFVSWESKALEPMIAAPVLCLGYLCFFLMLGMYLLEKRHEEALWLAVLWGVPAIFIVVSNCYFHYHFYTFCFSSVVTISLAAKYFLAEKHKPDGSSCVPKLEKAHFALVFLLSAALAFAAFLICWALKEGVNQFPLLNASVFRLAFVFLIVILIAYLVTRYNGILLLLFCLCLAFNLFSWGYFCSFASPKTRNLRDWANEAVERNAALVEQIQREANGEPVVFLDGAIMAPYVVDLPSYSRYLCQLPLQRNTVATTPGGSWQDQIWSCTQEELDRLMEYDGPFIFILSSWFKIDKYPQFKAKLEEEYEPYHHNLINGGSSSVGDFFQLRDLDNDNNYPPTLIYKRKEK